MSLTKEKIKKDSTIKFINKNKFNKMNTNIVKIKKKESITIGIIIPVTSRKRNYKKVEDTDFFRILFKSFLNSYNRDGNYKYNFYLGYDNDDKYFIDNKEKIIQHFEKIKGNNMSISLIIIENMQGKVGKIWSKLAEIASKDCKYLYQLGDDINIITAGWEDIFIKKLAETNNIGVTGPLDLTNHKILTQSFVNIIYGMFTFFNEKDTTYILT